MSDFVSADDTSYSERARALVRIGREAIAVENDAALDAYFGEEFVFHGPDGDLKFAELKSFFAAMRAAFTDFQCERRQIFGHGDLIAARTNMSGIFDHDFTASANGTVQPNGKPMTLELINFFRYDNDGRLAEEWVQYDNLGFLRQLGAEMEPKTQARV